jgi:hypothetical protein
MPTYVYVELRDDGSDGDPFEVVQKMSDPPLKVHPESGLPVRRIPTMPNLPLNHSDAAEKTKMSNKNLDRMGFTKYEKAGDGHYEKKAGKGPDVISRD